MMEFIAIIVLGGFAMLWVYSRQSMLEQNGPLLRSQDKQRRWANRLTNPDVDAFRRRFGCEISPLLKQIYTSDIALSWSECVLAPIEKAADGAEWHIASILPCDEEELAEVRTGIEGYFAFAADWKWDLYVVNPMENDPAVFLHEGAAGSLTKVCDRLSNFLSWKIVSKR